MVFIDGDSDYSGTLNFVDRDVDSSSCPSPGNRLFKEDEGSACFTGGPCEGSCQILARSNTCLANQVVTIQPTSSPVAPGAPTTSPTNATGTQRPTSVPVASPTASPVVAPTRSPVQPNLTDAPISALPTVSPITSAPTVRGTSAPTPVLSPAENLPTVQPTLCPGAKLYKKKPKPKTKLSKYGRSGSRKKKNKDFHPTEKSRKATLYYQNEEASATDSDVSTEIETKMMDEDGYEYFYVCPSTNVQSNSKKEGASYGYGESKSGKNKSSKSMMKGPRSKQKSMKSKGMSDKSMKGGSKDEKSKSNKKMGKSGSKSRRRLSEDMMDEIRLVPPRHK